MKQRQLDEVLPQHWAKLKHITGLTATFKTRAAMTKPIQIVLCHAPNSVCRFMRPINNCEPH